MRIIVKILSWIVRIVVAFLAFFGGVFIWSMFKASDQYNDELCEIWNRDDLCADCKNREYLKIYGKWWSNQ